MSTITREFTKEQLQQIIETDHVQCGEASSLARIALASLDAEPAIHRWRRVTSEPYGPYPWHYGDFIGFSKPVDGIEDEYFYSAPPAPVSVPDYPDVLPCPVMLEPGLRFGKGVPTRTMLGALQRRAEYYEELEAMTPEQRAEHDAGMKEFAAMLQGAEPVTTAYKLRDAVEIIRNSGIAIDAEKIFAERDALNAPDCWCRTCRPVTISDMRFVVCPECGNKRCPHANDHRNACTGSNEPGQEGSAYPAAQQQES